MRFINRSYRSVPPRSSDQRMFWTPELSQHAPAGVWAYAINPVASGGGFHFRYDGPIGVILSDEVRLLAVNLVRRNGAQALTGHSLAAIFPLSDLASPAKQLVAPQRQVSPLGGVANLELVDILGVGHAPLSGFRWTPCNTTAYPRPFLWPTCGYEYLCRYRFTVRSFGSSTLALAYPAQAFDRGTPRFVPARLGTTADISALGCTRCLCRVPSGNPNFSPRWTTPSRTARASPT